MKKYGLLILPVLMTSLLTGCNSSSNFAKKTNDDDLTVTTKSCLFENTTDEYDIPTYSMSLYFVNGSDVPYVSASDYFTDLNGLYESNKIQSSSSDKDITYYFQDSSYTYSMVVNWYDNYISFDDIYFTSAIIKSQEVTDYNHHLKFITGRGYGSYSAKFNLDSYYFDIFNYQGECLVPLSIYNLILGSSNYYSLVYNGEKIFGVYGTVRSGTEQYNQIYSSSYNDTQSSKTMREASFNTLCFAMDYYYGLKYNKGYTSYRNYISSSAKAKILSTNPKDNLDGYMDALVYQIDDLHTSLRSGSIYNKVSDVPLYYYSKFGSKWKSYYDTDDLLEGYRNTAFPDGEPDLRFIDNTAIISLTSFDTGTHDQIYDETGAIKADAYKYDSYYFMDKYLKEIGNYGNIDNVLVDLSNNGGGNVGAMFRVLGFMTNLNVTYNVYDTLCGTSAIYYYAVDANGDNNYLDSDAYTQYNWAILTSNCTFSAANTFTSTFNELGIGKSLGQKSGGGMCSIMPVVLSDSTFLIFSSNSSIRYNYNGTFYSIEDGLSPNYLLNYDKFYNDIELNACVNAMFSNN